VPRGKSRHICRAAWTPLAALRDPLQNSFRVARFGAPLPGTARPDAGARGGPGMGVASFSWRGPTRAWRRRRRSPPGARPPDRACARVLPWLFRQRARPGLQPGRITAGGALRGGRCGAPRPGQRGGRRSWPDEPGLPSQTRPSPRPPKPKPRPRREHLGGPQAAHKGFRRSAAVRTRTPERSARSRALRAGSCPGGGRGGPGPRVPGNTRAPRGPPKTSSERAPTAGRPLPFGLARRAGRVRCAAPGNRTRGTARLRRDSPNP